MCMNIHFSSTGMIDGKECEAFPLSPEELQHPSQEGAPAASLTSLVDLHMVKPSSDANEQGSLSEKVSSSEPGIGPTVPPVDASSSGSQMDQQARNHTEDTEKSAQFIGGSPASEGSKDDAGQDLLKQSEEIILEENRVPEVVNAPGNVFYFRPKYLHMLVFFIVIP